MTVPPDTDGKADVTTTDIPRSGHRGKRGRAARHQLVRLVVRDGDRCHWCRELFGAAHPVTLEHLTPLCYGGSTDDANTVLACEGCNTARQHRVWCSRCGCRIRRWTSVVWVRQRYAYHAGCFRALVAELVADG